MVATSERIRSKSSNRLVRLPQATFTTVPGVAAGSTRAGRIYAGTALAT
jgi:hypothetical protein